VAIALRVLVSFLALVVVVIPTMQLASAPSVGSAEGPSGGAAAKALSGARTLATTLEPPTVRLFLAVTPVVSPAPPAITPGFCADLFVPPRA
jgi:hypothetical protein